MLSKILKFKRYILAISGTAGVSAANFLLSGVLLLIVSPESFGLFAFIQVIIALGYGISNALIGSPLMYFVNRDETPQTYTIESYFKFNLIFCLTCTLALFCALYLTMESPLTATYFALAAGLLWYRWFGRSYKNTLHQPETVAFSDISYALVTILGVVFLYFNQSVTLQNFALLQVISALIGIIALGKNVLCMQVKSIAMGSFSIFKQGFIEKGKHSLLGVITTEATANAHSYIVVTFFGPAAFAPLAAGLLLFRPVPILISTLTQLERPKIAQRLKASLFTQALKIVKQFRLIILVAWFFNASLALIVIVFFADPILKDNYDFSTVLFAVGLWAAITGFRCLRGPDSALLQANGDFKPLSLVTLKSAGFTLPLVFVLTYLLGPKWSLFGVLVGELIAVKLTMQLARKQIPQENL
jgi:O-antigen/teichoic acid export membrane protein